MNHKTLFRIVSAMSLAAVFVGRAEAQDCMPPAAQPAAQAGAARGGPPAGNAKNPLLLFPFKATNSE